jgi:HlyD family secretion protein
LTLAVRVDTTDNVPLSSLVNGKVTFVQLKNNQVVQQGDTLIKLTQENLDTEKATNQDLVIDLQDRIGNLSFLGKNASNMAFLT